MTKKEKKKLKEGMQKTIKRLSMAQIKKNGKFHGANLHSVTALCICCFIDALGKYVYGGQADECKFKRFIEKYMPNFYKALLDKAVKEGAREREKYLSKFYRDFRCGLVHEYFSKTEVISRNCNKIVFGSKNELKICLPRLKEEWEKAFAKAIVII